MGDKPRDYRFPTGDDAPPPPRFRGPQDVPYLVRWLLLNDPALKHELWSDRDNVGRLIDEVTGDTVRYRKKRQLQLQLIRLYDQYRAARYAAEDGHQQAKLDEVVFEAKLRALEYIYQQKYGHAFDLANAEADLAELYDNWEDLPNERRQLLRMLRQGDYPNDPTDQLPEDLEEAPRQVEQAGVSTTGDQLQRQDQNQRIYDVSIVLSESIWVWPGDMPFGRKWTGQLSQNDEGELIGANTSAYTMSAHMGTHVDAPLHVGEGTTDVLQLPLDTLIGRCHVVSVGATPIITTEDLLALPISLAPVERLILHTGAGDEARDEGQFSKGFPAIDPDAAQLLVDNDIILFGIDAPSVDSEETHDLPNHHIFARGGVVMLEGLCLHGVPDGEYELIALPLPVRGGDGSPVRAVLRTVND